MRRADPLSRRILWCVWVYTFVRACRRVRSSVTVTLYTFTLEVRTDRLSRNLGNYKYRLSNITEGGTAVAEWLRYCATNREVAGSIPDGVIGIFH
jgi:hypothetical protein